MSAQISRTARRLSTVIAPQLTKLDPLPSLQKVARVSIKIADIKKVKFSLIINILYVHFSDSPRNRKLYSS